MRFAMKSFVMGAVVCAGLLWPTAGQALKCRVPSFEESVTESSTVVVGRVLKNESGKVTLQVLKLLKDKGLLKGKKTFVVPKWEYYQPTYRVGQILLYTFGGSIGVKCNLPIVIL